MSAAANRDVACIGQKPGEGARLLGGGRDEEPLALGAVAMSCAGAWATSPAFRHSWAWRTVVTGVGSWAMKRWRSSKLQR